MGNRIPVLLGAVAGAIAGAACGYLYFTDAGRRLRADLEPKLEDLAREWSRARDAAARAGQAAGDGWQSVRQMDQTLRADGPESGWSH